MIYHWLQWTITFSGFPDNSVGKESACNAGDSSSIPGRSPGKGIGYPPQYSGLENSVDCIVHGVAKSQTLPSDFQWTKQSSEPFFSGPFLACHFIQATTISWTVYSSNSEKLPVSQHTLLSSTCHLLSHHFLLFALECPSPISLHPSLPGLFAVFCLSFRFQLREEVTFQKFLPKPHTATFFVPRSVSTWYLAHTSLTELMILNCYHWWQKERFYFSLLNPRLWSPWQLRWRGQFPLFIFCA